MSHVLLFPYLQTLIEGCPLEHSVKMAENECDKGTSSKSDIDMYHERVILPTNVLYLKSKTISESYYHRECTFVTLSLPFPIQDIK